VGVAIPHYAEMTAFCRDVLGLEVAFEEPAASAVLAAGA
jgi:hypothetical protein